MRKIHFRSQLDTPLIEAFAFFALAIDEKLYDQTDDSFKAPALNTYTRTLELQVVAHTNFVAGISRDALKPFLEELEWSIARDPALSSEQRLLCKVHIDQISARLNESEQVSRGVAGLRIVLRDYFQSIQRAILQILENNPKQKSELTELAASFVIQAELEGFPRRHTYHIVQNILINPLKHESAIDPLKVLSDFFAAFVPKSREFDCLFQASSSLSAHPDLLKRFDLQLLADPPAWKIHNEHQKQFLSSKKEQQTWLLADEIEARSAAEAHEIVASTFDALASVLRFFEHKSDLQISRLSLTLDRDSKHTYMFHEAPDPMHCWVGNIQVNEADCVELSDAIHAGHLTSDGAMRLSRALRFHKAALLSNSTENQLIDLWAALEGLLPIPRRDSLRVEYFSESLLPALTLTYPEKLFSSAYHHTLKVVPKIKDILDGLVSNGSDFAKFVQLLLCAELAGDRDKLLELLSGDPLLRNKLWRLAEAFKTRTAIQNTLRHHRRKVKWHLARIYYTRNSLMHSASSLPHLGTLVENLHLYVDTLIRVIARVAHTSPEVLSIEGALQYLAAWERYRLESITHEGADNNVSPTLDQVWPVVFGRDMLLAPRFEAAAVAKN